MCTKLCIRCGIEGHTCKVCYGPITSFGLIVYGKRKNLVNVGEMYSNTFNYTCKYEHVQDDEKYCIFNTLEKNKQYDNQEEYHFLLVERKDTISFIALIQGVYNDSEPERSIQITRHIQNLTCEERYKLENFSWDQLWEIAGSNKNKLVFEKKFNELNISNFLRNSTCKFTNAMYLMPKGRLKVNESTRDAAIREFSEETGYTKNDITLLDCIPFVENFTGINGKKYRNVYYIAKIKKNATINVPLHDIQEQSKEVRNVGWFKLNECFHRIRDLCKKRILYNASQFIQQYNC